MSLIVEVVAPTRTHPPVTTNVVSAPTPRGEISVLPGHVPLVTAVSSGELRLGRGEEATVFAVAGGLLKVRDGTRVVVLTDVAEPAEEISEAAAEEACRRAAALRVRVAADDVAFASATAALEREIARLRVARRARRARPHRLTQ